MSGTGRGIGSGMFCTTEIVHVSGTVNWRDTVIVVATESGSAPGNETAVGNVIESEIGVEIGTETASEIENETAKGNAKGNAKGSETESASVVVTEVGFVNTTVTVN